MKNIKVWKKLGIGFGVLIALMTVLGTVSIQQLYDIRRESDKIEQLYMPEMAIATRLERESHLTIEAMLRFSNSGTKADWTTAQEHFAQVKQSLDEARKLVERQPALTVLRGNVDALSKGVGEYAQLADQTRDTVINLLAVQQDMVKSGQAFSAVLERLIQDRKAAQLASIEEDASAWSLKTHAEALDLTHAILDKGNEIRVLNASAQALNDPAKLHAALELFDAMQLLFQRLGELLPGADTQSLLSNLDGLADAYRSDIARMVTVWTERARLNRERTQASQIILDTAQKTSAAALEATNRIAEQTVDMAERAALMLEGGVAASVLIGLLFALYLTRIITRPLNKGVNFATAVAGGDLDSTLDVHRRDELGRLADALTTMVAHLKEKIREAEAATARATEKEHEARTAVAEAEQAKLRAENARREGMLHAAGQLEDVVRAVNEASDSLSVQITQADRGAGEQARLAGETAASMNEMNAAVASVSAGASDAAEASAHVKSKAEEGARQVEKTVRGMHDLYAASSAVSDDMQDLGKRTEAIGHVLGVISDIADQTNLLALNAAIEAARAGEAGKGFAVVADNVRQLAEKTMTATREVGDSIQGIQEGVRKNIANVAQSGEVTRSLTEIANLSGALLQEIVSLAEEASDKVRSIAAASEEQSASTESINRSVDAVKQISDQTVDAMRAAGGIVGELAEQAHGLADLIADMKRA